LSPPSHPSGMAHSDTFSASASRHFRRARLLGTS